MQGSRKMKVPSPLNWLRILKLLIEEITFYLYGLLLAERKFSLVDTLCKVGLKDSAFPLKRRGLKSIPDEQFLNFFRFPFLLFLLLLSSPKGFFFHFVQGVTIYCAVTSIQRPITEEQLSVWEKNNCLILSKVLFIDFVFSETDYLN